MTRIKISAAALRISGDDLNPEEISGLLGCVPSRSYVKGETVLRLAVGGERKASTGTWSLEVPDCEPENLDQQIAALLSQVSSEAEVWDALAQRFEIDLFCGLFMEETNNGLDLAPEMLSELGKRRIRLSLDIYGPTGEDSES